MLHRAIEDAIERKFMEALAERLASKGLTLSSSEQKRLLRRLREGKTDDAFVVRRSNWRFWERAKPVSFEIGEDDLAAITRSVEGLEEPLSIAVSDVLQESGPALLSQLRRRWPSERRDANRELGKFETRLRERWFAPLDLMEMLIAIAANAGAMHNQRLRAASDFKRPTVLDVTTRLHARACQVANEILILLRHGYADGAMARWRTLHELSVTALFISQGDDETARRYSEYEVVESAAAAEDYRDHQTRLGFDPIRPTELANLHRLRNELCERYGKAFGGPYGWAAHRFPSAKMDFAKLAAAVQVQHFTPYVNLAHQRIHAGPKGVFFQLGSLGDDNRILLIGPSNYGLADPGARACHDVVLASLAVLLLDTNVDAVVCLSMLESLSREAEIAFVDTQKQIEREESE